MNTDPDPLLLTHIKKKNGILNLVHNSGLRSGDAALYRRFNNCLQWNCQLAHHIPNVSPNCYYCSWGNDVERESYYHLVRCNKISPIR